MLVADLPDLPYEILLFLVAAIIAIVNRVVDVARKARRQAAEEQRRRDQAEGVRLGERPRPPADHAAPVAPPPAAAPRPPVLPRPPVPPPLPFPSPQVPPPLTVPPPPRRHPPRLQLGPPAAVQPDTELWRLAKPPRPAEWAARKKRRHVHPAAAALRASPERLRDAIVLREVLGPPVAYRRFRM